MVDDPKPPEIELLQRLVEYCHSGSLAIHIAHVNVTGPSFGALHALYQEGYELLDEWFDTFAERIRACGGMMGNNLKPYGDMGEVGSGDYVAGVEGVVSGICEVADEIADKLVNAPVTQNMVLEFIAEVDKFRWKVRASR